jgi:hypothetical protein
MNDDERLLQASQTARNRLNEVHRLRRVLEQVQGVVDAWDENARDRLVAALGNEPTDCVAVKRDTATYAETALAGSADHDDHRCAAQLRDALARGWR